MPDRLWPMQLHVDFNLVSFDSNKFNQQDARAAQLWGQTPWHMNHRLNSIMDRCIRLGVLEIWTCFSLHRSPFRKLTSLSWRSITSTYTCNMHACIRICDVCVVRSFFWTARRIDVDSIAYLTLWRPTLARLTMTTRLVPPNFPFSFFLFGFRRLHFF